jgi:hypothetical protein
MYCARQFRSRSKKAFFAALDRIAAANREPTALEAGCLFGALGAMTNGDEHSAERKIALCLNADFKQQRSWKAPPQLTVAGLRRAFLELNSLSGHQMRPNTTKLPPLNNRPTCSWCGRGKLDLIKEWPDPTYGMIGVTLRCDTPECGKLTAV